MLSFCLVGQKIFLFPFIEEFGIEIVILLVSKRLLRLIGLDLRLLIVLLNRKPITGGYILHRNMIFKLFINFLSYEIWYNLFLTLFFWTVYILNNLIRFPFPFTIWVYSMFKSVILSHQWWMSIGNLSNHWYFIIFSRIFLNFSGL